MKNYELLKSNVVFQHLIFRMKLTCLFIISFVSGIFATNVTSQVAKISLSLNQAKVGQIIDAIEDQTDYLFVYDRNEIDLDREVSISVENKTVAEVLSTIFKNTNVVYAVEGTNIMLMTFDKNSLSAIIGKVTDKNGNPLTGVTVVVKNTTIGTITDSNGKYSISNVPENATLQFAFVGMKTMEFIIGTSTQIDVTMEESVHGLDEVVVVGYGTQTKRFVTGAISKVDIKQVENLPITNITQALRGRIAGVQFTDDGRPGQNGSILVRGPRSLSAGNNPLIVLDGIIFNGSMIDINSNDIASIEILKDASASAIYGSRAANGVILVTSKKGGATEKPTINMSFYSGLSDWSSKLKVLSPERYLQKSMDVRTQTGVTFDPNDPETYLTLTEAKNFREGKVVDSYDAISQQGKIFSADISLSANTKNINYYISASLSQENGLVYNDNLRRISYRVNIENKIADWLKIGTNAMFSSNIIDGVPADISLAMRQSPFGTWYHDDGTPTQFTVPEDQGASPNPMRDSFLSKREYVRNNLLSNFYAIVNIPKIDGLTFRINYSPNLRWIRDYNSTKQDIYLPKTNTTSASKRNWAASDWVLENILNYNFKVKEKHAFDMTLMYGANMNSFETTTATSTQLITDIFDWNKLEVGTILTNKSSAEKSSGTSSMARLNYRFNEKYLLTFTVRRDGSSVFAANYKYATFPSAALSWIVSDERFMKNLKFIEFLKLRVSHGTVGNQAISPYQSLSLASTNYYVFGDGNQSSIGIYPSNISNANLKWETTITSNVAIDFQLFKDRIGGTFEVYNMDTKNLLVERSLPIMTGYTSIWTNLGLINNKGIELTLNTINLKRSKFEWSSNFVFSHNKNKIIHLYGSDTNGDGKEDDDLGNKWFIGQPINIYYDYVFDGIYQEGETLPAGYQPGFARFKDLNNDGKVEANNDRKIIGQSSEPKYRWGMTNTLTFGNFELSVFINAMHGWIGAFNRLDYNYDSVDPIRSGNLFDVVWWTKENKSTSRPSLAYKRSVLGNNWYSSKDFIRIQDISLVYTLPKSFLQKHKLSNLNIIASGKNLLTFTDWLGTNPEVLTDFPMARTYALGLKLSF
jgi:TonB-linked SusC/RagA family outer membrane protein